MRRHAMTREQALKALELHAGASFQEIKQAYRDLALVWHPDRFASHSARLQEKATERLKEINTAYHVLRSYDDSPSRAHEPRPKHTGSKHGATRTERSGTEKQRGRAKNHSAGRSAEDSESQNARETRERLIRYWQMQRSRTKNRSAGPATETSEFEDFMDRLSRLWNRLPTPVGIAGHLVAVFCFWLSIKREVYPAFVSAMFFTFTPLICIRCSDGIESWREAIESLWVWSVLLVAGFVLWMSGFAVLDRDWFVIEAPIAALLLLVVVVIIHIEEPDSIVAKIIVAVTQGIAALLILPLILLFAVMFGMFELCRFVFGPLTRLVRRKQQG